jgi:hypothetical protein
MKVFSYSDTENLLKTYELQKKIHKSYPHGPTPLIAQEVHIYAAQNPMLRHIEVMHFALENNGQLLGAVKGYSKRNLKKLEFILFL